MTGNVMNSLSYYFISSRKCFILVIRAVLHFNLIDAIPFKAYHAIFMAIKQIFV